MAELTDEEVFGKELSDEEVFGSPSSELTDADVGITRETVSLPPNIGTPSQLDRDRNVIPPITLSSGGAQPKKEKTGVIEGLMGSAERGLLSAQQMVATVVASEAQSALEDERYRAEAGLTVPEHRRKIGTLVNPVAESSKLLNRTPEQRAESLQKARLFRDVWSGVVSEFEKDKAKIPLSEAQSKLAAAKTSGDKWSVFKQYPVQTVSSIILESLPPAIAGATIGSVGGPPGMIAGVGTASGLAEFSSSFIQSASEAGYDPTDEKQLNQFLESTAFNEAINKAQARAAIVGGIDAATAGFAGRFIEPALKQGLKQVLIASGKEVALQAGGGAGGEFTAQSVTKGDKPYDWFDIAMEAVAEIATGPAEIVGNIRSKLEADASTSDNPTESKIEQMLNEQAAASLAPQTAQAATESDSVIQPTGGDLNEEGRQKEEGLQVDQPAESPQTTTGSNVQTGTEMPAQQVGQTADAGGVPVLHGSDGITRTIVKLHPDGGGVGVAIPPSADPESRWGSLFAPLSISENPTPAERLVVLVTNSARRRLADKWAGLKNPTPNDAAAVAAEGSAMAKQYAEVVSKRLSEKLNQFLREKKPEFLRAGVSEKEFSGWVGMVDFYTGIAKSFLSGANVGAADTSTLRAAIASAQAHLSTVGNLVTAIGGGRSKPELQAILSEVYGLSQPQAQAQSGGVAPETLNGRTFQDIVENYDQIPTEEMKTPTSGVTGFSWALGAMARTPEDVAKLREIAARNEAKARELMEAGDLEGAMAIAGRQPAEAYEYATGVKLDGTPKWQIFEKRTPGYTPPVPDEAYIKAKQAESTLQSEIQSEAPEGEEAGNRDVFSMDDDELGEFFKEQFGDTGETGTVGQAGFGGMFSFPNYGAFRTWMDARYAERDIESMKLAFVEASTEFKKQFIKDNKGSSDHKKAWVLHLATGAILPDNDPPIARKTPLGEPEPEPTAPPPGEPPSDSPPAAPTAPRPPSRRVQFDIMALTQLLRMFDKFPEVNARLTKAYGQYVRGSGKVQIKERLLWDKDLAERVLAHESGHFVDLFLSPPGDSLPFADKLSPLRDFRYHLSMRDEWRRQAVALSRAWRGPFSPRNQYRNSPEELFADFMSAIMTKPEWVNQNFPVLHDAFAELLAGKGDFRAAYDEMTRWLEGGTMVSEWRDQQGSAVKATIDDLVAEKKRHRQSIWSYIRTATLTTWADAWGKERPTTDIGSATSEDLEVSGMWAAKENALFADLVIRDVYPKLQAVDPDMVKAQTYLHEYTQALRTIGERRAAGAWIESNPDPARAMLLHISGLDPILQNKYSNSIQLAANDQLYDLAGEMLREIHDRGDKFISRIRREIDNLNLGVTGEAALTAFNVRGKLLNPGGLTPDRAQQVIDEIRGELGPDKMRSLEEAAANMRDLLYKTQEAAHQEGLISDYTWNEIIEPNKDNYVPYAVLDYWGGEVGAGVRPQKGTAKDIAATAFATQLKVASLNAWRQRQRQVKLLMDVYAKGGTPITLGQKLRRPQDLESIRASHRDDDISRAVLWKDGSPHLVEFPENPGKTFEKAMDSRSFYQYLEPLAKLSGIGHSIMQLYTTLSLPFMVYRNPVRGARTSAGRIGYTKVGKGLAKEGFGLLEAMAATVDPNATSISDELGYAARLALNYARAAFGEVMLPEVRDLVDKQILLPPRMSQAMIRNPDNLRHMIENGGILAFQVEQAKKAGWPLWARLAPTRAAFKFAEEVFTAYEAFEKIYSFEAAKGRGLSQDKAAGVARRSGIPNPGVGGYLTMPIELFFPWTRVKIQGLRSSLDTARDPEMGRGFMTRFAITEAIPRAAKVAIGFGLMAGTVKWLTGNKDEDEEDPVMAEVIKRVSPYKMALDDTFPLMLYDPRTGKYSYFNDYKSGKSIPAHLEVVSLRIPSSEEGRTFGPLLYHSLANSPMADSKIGAPGGDIMSSFGSWIKSEMAPNPSPAIETTKNLYEMLVLGNNPEDPFRKQPSANAPMFDAGWGGGRGQAIAGYTLNQLGFAGDIAAIAAMNFGLLDERAVNAVKKRMAGDKVPIQERMVLIKNMLSYDNYSQYRDEKNAQIDEEKIRARAKLALSSEVRAIYDFYYRNVSRQEKLDLFGKRRFVIAKDFHERWGKADDPWSLYARAIAASNPKTSEMARESSKRDLDLLTSPYVARWNFLNQISE